MLIAFHGLFEGRSIMGSMRHTSDKGKRRLDQSIWISSSSLSKGFSTTMVLHILGNKIMSHFLLFLLWFLLLLFCIIRSCFLFFWCRCFLFLLLCWFLVLWLFFWSCFRFSPFLLFFLGFLLFFFPLRRCSFLLSFLLFLWFSFLFGIQIYFFLPIVCFLLFVSFLRLLFLFGWFALLALFLFDGLSLLLFLSSRHRCGRSSTAGNRRDHRTTGSESLRVAKLVVASVAHVRQVKGTWFARTGGRRMAGIDDCHGMDPVGDLCYEGRIQLVVDQDPALLAVIAGSQQFVDDRVLVVFVFLGPVSSSVAGKQNENRIPGLADLAQPLQGV
mmetsp:Transcript_30243/g.64858  ORF Transcript_30243/g.64858 Transcript_30243/m.64858 type:complete len:329 (+) Transcript_30243:801-1787(+)